MTSGERDRLTGDADAVRRAFDDAPIIIGSMHGPEHRLTACNAAFRAYWPRGVLLGRPLEEIAPELRGLGIIDLYDEVYQTGRPVRVTDLRTQVDLDGSGVQEHFINITAVPQRAADGSVTGISFVGTDSTEQVRARLAAEQDAREMSGRYESLRDSAIVMQQALLAHGVPLLPGADIAAAYLVAAEDTAAGGDWFDALPHPGGGVGLVLGDVVGHGVGAAAVMAQLRTATRMQLDAGASLREALTAVDRFAAGIAGAKSATLCVALLDTTTGDFEYCTAGHPPPLLIETGRTPRYLEPTGAGPLGSGRGFATRTAHLEISDMVLLYSDGIIERPGRTPPASSAEVINATTRVLRGEAFPLDPARPPVERLCSQAVELLIRTTGYTDDITLLAVQRRTAPQPLHIVVPADKIAERTVREELRGWLCGLGADSANGRLLEHAVSECVANAAEHAYAPDTFGEVTFDAALHDDGRVRATVADKGTWKVDATKGMNRGRGLSIAQAMVPDTVVRHDDHGTTVGISHAVTRAAHIVSASAIAPGLPTTSLAETFEIVVGADGRVTVFGDVDAVAAPSLAGSLSMHSQAGAKHLDIDLSAVTHLGSAGVSVLVDVYERATRQHRSCRLVAPPGGAAHHVLSLVGLPTAGADTSTGTG